MVTSHLVVDPVVGGVAVDGTVGVGGGVVLVTAVVTPGVVDTVIINEIYIAFSIEIENYFLTQFHTRFKKNYSSEMNIYLELPT